ncbi:hypothetical protein ElyMa_003014700 [Elysia marginata]|uniref:Uncharacterized protein n=1 Tax=Elysia marginata TaxID=1093978 RepID=A0AAV4IFD2_9GAST|nr:hypothetical protein ElyMa_003014700 [Elysia marginata]
MVGERADSTPRWRLQRETVGPKAGVDQAQTGSVRRCFDLPQGTIVSPFDIRCRSLASSYPNTPGPALSVVQTVVSSYPNTPGPALSVVQTVVSSYTNTPRSGRRV